jgi:hypothetical protein
MPMKSDFLAVGGRSPYLLGGENAVAFEDTREGEEKKDLVEGAVTGLPRCQCMSCQDTLDTLITIGHHPLSCQKDPHLSPWSTCLMRPHCAAVACETHCFHLAGWRADFRWTSNSGLLRKYFVSAIPTSSRIFIPTGCSRIFVHICMEPPGLEEP